MIKFKNGLLSNYFIPIFFIYMLVSCTGIEPEFPTDCMCSDKFVCIINKDSSPTLIADGKSIIEFLACIPNNSDEIITQITFEAPVESGDFSIEGGTSSITKNLEINRSTTAKFKVSNNPGSFRIKAKVIFNNISYEGFVDIILKPLNKEVFDINYDKDLTNLSADNYSEFRSIIKINNLNFKNKQVECLVNGPIKFIGSDENKLNLEINELGQTTAHFKVLDHDGNATISYLIDNFSFYSTFYIKKSYPEEFKIISNKNSILYNDSITISVYLNKKLPGNVSINLPIFLLAFQKTANGIIKYGYFDPPFLYTSTIILNIPNAQGKYFSPSEDLWDKDQPLYIVGSIEDSQSNIISDTLSFKIY